MIKLQSPPWPLPSPFSGDVAWQTAVITSGNTGDVYTSRDTYKPSRDEQFQAGRELATRALLASGCEATPNISRGPQGEPLWPPGFTGTISHTGNVVVVATAPRTESSGLGVDIEFRFRKVSPNVGKRICTPTELAWAREPGHDSNERLLSIFCIKEAIYKALYPTVKSYFGYQTVRLNFKANPVIAIPLVTLGPVAEGTEIPVAIKITDQCIYAGVKIPRL